MSNKNEWKVGRPYIDKPFMVYTIDGKTGKTKDIIGWVENEANAHLIAAAPDMYEALKLILKDHTYSYEDIRYKEAVKAISKAEGKQ